jgi:predicted MPP superfamily phosphohydrolase
MTYLIVALACIGHLVLMAAIHNSVYGLRLPKWLGHLNHLFAFVVTLALPIGLVAGWGWSLDGFLSWPPSCWVHATILAWMGLCLFTLFVLLPFVTIRRALRKEPITVTRRETVDLAKQLGHRPVGVGHHAWLAHLPYNELFQVEFIEATLHPPRLPPALDGLTILHLTDLHFHGTPDREWFAAVIERCNAWQPDIVALTGDVVDTYTHHRWIIPLLGRLRYKHTAFAILGNHDHDLKEPEIIRRRLRRLGMTVVSNGWAQTTINGEPLVIVGTEAPWLEPQPDLSDCPAGPFRLCLSHTPDNIVWARQHGIDVVLAGHVHGGQIRFPVFGPLVMPSKFGRWYDQGAFDEPPSLLYVGRGLSGEEAVRYNCLPEVTLITLRRPPGATHDQPRTT